MSSLLQVENLSKSYGDVVLFKNISLGILEGQKVALIAKNGTGKTSLLEIMAGNDQADSGSVTKQGGLSVGYLPQDPKFDMSKRVIDQIFISDNLKTQTIREYESAMQSNDKLRMERAINAMDAADAWEYEQQIKQILTELKITDFEQPVSELSGGQKKRIALANVLITEPELLILDEPTNHLDLEMIEWLEVFLSKARCTLFMVTHDRYFLDRVCSEILEMEDNVIYKYKGNYSYYLEKREERILATNANIEKARNLLRKEKEWMGRQPQARATKAKARIEGYYALKEKAAGKAPEQQLELDIQTRRLGSKILEIHHLNKRFDDKVMLDDFSYTFARFEKVGIVGRNGAGKSTFLNLITSMIPADSGTIETGETVVYGYYRQEGLKLDEDKRAIEVIKDIAEVITLGNNRTLSASQFLEYFLFSPETQYTYVSRLSGGERRRLYLMTILMTNPNFLILDEPTNDLDIMTLNVLEDYLASFGGCLIVVSHDRFFMDKVVDHLFVFEGDGKVVNFPGNYSDYRYDLDQEEKKAKMEQKAVKEVKREANVSPAAPVVRKMTFKEKKEFEALEVEIAQLTQERAELEEAINSAGLQQAELMKRIERLGVVVNLIDEKEMRWLELSEI